MKFGFLTEGDTPPGASAANRYHEVIREAQVCDEMNLNFWGSSEPHFTDPVATISAPEVLYGAIAYAMVSMKSMAYRRRHICCNCAYCVAALALSWCGR
jgi:hypothetical protein